MNEDRDGISLEENADAKSMSGRNISGCEENNGNEASIVSPLSLHEYKGYSLQEKVSMLGLRMSDNMIPVFAIVKEYFENNDLMCRLMNYMKKKNSYLRLFKRMR